MRIGRKEALLALVAIMIPWIGRRANAQVPRVPLKEPTTVRTLPQTPEVADLQRRVAALEAQLANQVAFTKDSAGNLNVRGAASVTIESGANLTMKAGYQAQLYGSGPTTIKGSTIALN